jgi:periplasmic protein TonB
MSIHFMPVKNDWNEIVFENRHKSYGAYLLRKDYDRTLLRSFIIILSGLLILSAGAILFTYLNKHITPRPARKDPYELSKLKVELPSTLAREVKPANRPRPRPSSSKPAPVFSSDSIHEPSVGPQASDQRLGPGTGVSDTSGEGSHGDGKKGLSPEKFLEGTADNPTEVPDIFPEFPGGEAALQRFISNHMNLDKLIDLGVQRARVLVSFVIDPEGNVTDVVVLTKNGHGLEDEALSAFNKMPKWKPGQHHAKNVYVKLLLPLHLELR